MAGFGRKPSRGDGYSKRTAKECLKHDWRFKGKDPESVADEWRSQTFSNWEKDLWGRQREGIVLTREELFKPRNEFTELRREFRDGSTHELHGGYWGVYIIDEAKEAAKNNTRDWGIWVKVGEYGSMAGAGLIRKAITESLGEDTYEEFKTVLMNDLSSLTECMNKGSVWLEEQGLLGVSFVCSESSERLLRRLRMRVERGWVFWFSHYSW